MENKEIWERVKWQVARERTGKAPISTKWVIVNKGDAENPEIRAILVAREIKTYNSDAFYASTPPMEATRALFSRLAT